jgi:8-oxo-dGTP pyrophosphatase MutT (NUDIX family)
MEDTKSKNKCSKCGNELRFARVNYIFKMPIMKQIFLWVLYVHVYIKDEDRIKDNEFVISRTDISSIVIYKKDKEDILNSDIVLVKEFRSPANNSKSMVYEIPGGSSFKDNSDINQVIQDEIEEETGLIFDKDRIQYNGARQLMATLSSHKCHLFSVEINDKELEDIKSQVGSVHGVEEDTERTYLEIYKMKDLLECDFVDWSNIGYILSILNK